MKYKPLFCAALACSLLTLPTLAAEDTASHSAQLPQAPSVETPAFTLERPTNMDWSLFWGTAHTVKPDSVLVDGGGPQANSQTLFHISADTVILNAVSGAKMTPNQLRTGETLYLYSGPATTMSLPPQTTAKLILAGIPADYGVPTCHQITSLTRSETGLTVHTAEAVDLHLSKETTVLGDRTFDKLTPGDHIVAWYDLVAESYPAQAWPKQIFALPSEYDGWLTTDGKSLSLNGKELTFTALEMPHLQNDTLLLPLRRVAETLGCTVTWDAAQSERIVVTDATGLELYTITIGSKDSIPTSVQSGVTFVSAQDLITLHHLFLSN